ncbi:MAG TPA: hypothetical protein VK986_07675 [Tepidisphaeraceae bacterium]|nr:hypothetical protein [Tepidisphaeraceae bacterium]
MGQSPVPPTYNGAPIGQPAGLGTRRLAIFLSCASALLASIAGPALAADPATGPAAESASFLGQECHAGPKPKGDVRVDGLLQDFSGPKIAQQWTAALEARADRDRPAGDRDDGRQHPRQELRLAIVGSRDRAEQDCLEQVI